MASTIATTATVPSCLLLDRPRIPPFMVFLELETLTLEELRIMLLLLPPLDSHAPPLARCASSSGDDEGTTEEETSARYDECVYSILPSSPRGSNAASTTINSTCTTSCCTAAYHSTADCDGTPPSPSAPPVLVYHFDDENLRAMIMYVVTHPCEHVADILPFLGTAMCGGTLFVEHAMPFFLEMLSGDSGNHFATAGTARSADDEETEEGGDDGDQRGADDEAVTTRPPTFTEEEEGMLVTTLQLMIDYGASVSHGALYCVLAHLPSALSVLLDAGVDLPSSSDPSGCGHSGAEGDHRGAMVANRYDDANVRVGEIYRCATENRSKNNRDGAAGIGGTLRQLFAEGFVKL